MASVEKDLSLNLKIQPTSFLKKRLVELAGVTARINGTFVGGLSYL
jgi:hypothetical protein